MSKKPKGKPAKKSAAKITTPAESGEAFEAAGPINEASTEAPVSRYRTKSRRLKTLDQGGTAVAEATPPPIVEEPPTPAETNGHPPRAPEILRTTTRELPCTLTDAEKAKLAGELVATIEKAEQEEADQDEQKKEMKAVLAGLAAQQSRLARALSRGIETRLVEVRIEADFALGLARTVRTDTSEVVETRPLTDSERQPALIPDVAKAAETAAVVHSESAEGERG